MDKFERLKHVNQLTDKWVNRLVTSPKRRSAIDVFEVLAIKGKKEGFTTLDFIFVGERAGFLLGQLILENERPGVF